MLVNGRYVAPESSQRLIGCLAVADHPGPPSAPAGTVCTRTPASDTPVAASTDARTAPGTGRVGERPLERDPTELGSGGRPRRCGGALAGGRGGAGGGNSMQSGGTK
ncbi:hypothetical protein ABZ671_15310 [Micromonospora sp. NPDC006766]|uniref:hypothetical protein n=1 Tax=Micromonospora sp. NPDC006766 TaxID=3154778 RepID=UPI0033E6737D